MWCECLCDCSAERFEGLDCSIGGISGRRGVEHEKHRGLAIV